MESNGKQSLFLGLNGFVWYVGNVKEHENEKDLRSESDLIPKVIGGQPAISTISCGYSFVVCVDYDGFVWSFGSNNYGQLGHGDKSNRAEPTQVAALQQIVTVSCGSQHTICLDKKSAIWSFGLNRYGQLGTKQPFCLASPQKYIPPEPIQSIVCGGMHTLLLCEGGDVFGCGSNSMGQLGFRLNSTSNLIQRLGEGTLPPIQQIACGYHRSVFLSNNGRVYCCGSYNGGRVEYRESVLVELQLPTIKLISCGYDHTMCVDEEGSLWTFGLNIHGQLGLGDTRDRTEPEKVPELENICLLSRGGYLTMCADIDGNIYVFGYNEFGGLGLEDTQNRLSPVKLPQEFCENIITPKMRVKSAKK